MSSYAEYYGAVFPAEGDVRSGGTASPVDSFASYYGAFFPAESDTRNTTGAPLVVTTAMVEPVKAPPPRRRTRRRKTPIVEPTPEPRQYRRRKRSLGELIDKVMKQ